MPHLGLMLDSTETHCLRAVIQDGRVVLQTLAVSQEVVLTRAQFRALKTWLVTLPDSHTSDAVLEELARVEALSHMKRGD